MIQAYKDQAHTFAISPDYPLTLVASQTGGVKESGFFLQMGSSYPAGCFLTITPTGTDLQRDPAPYSLGIKQATQSWDLAIQNNVLLLAVTANATLALTVRVIVAAQTAQTRFAGSTVQLSVLNAQSAVIDYLTIPILIVAADQGLRSRFRLLTADRQLPANPPGFIFGSARWRSEPNANVLVPTNWNQDLTAIGYEKFIPGIGCNDDLKLDRLYRQGHSVLPIIRHGEYFTGPNRYFMPSKDSRIEIFPITQSHLQFTLADAPVEQFPVYAGTFRSTSAGSFEEDVAYRYLGRGLAANQGGWDTAKNDYQFQVNRKTKTLTVNRNYPITDAFVGLLPEASLDSGGQTMRQSTFDLPVFPMWDIQSAYLSDPSKTCQVVNFDRAAGQITVSVPVAGAGERLFVSYTPAIAAIYETAAAPVDPTDPAAPQPAEKLLTTTELNPAFSGLSSGHLYLLHRRQRAMRITLAADKPLIPIPKTLASSTNLIAYGPVYYTGDFAQLMATVSGATPDQLIPGADLAVIPADDFEGYINYQDPVTSQVTMSTGGDGTSPMIYTPNKSYGFYLALSSIASNVMTLPEPLALAQLWSPDDGWYLLTYQVDNDDPVLGKVGANTQAGEIPWTTFGQAGTVQYKTNGLRVIWASSAGYPVVPTQAFDAAGHAAFNGNGTLNVSFDGNAVRLQYASPLPAPFNVGAYFIGFVGRVRLRVQDLATGILSNSIMLQLAPPPQVVDSPSVQGYLYLDSNATAKMGRINVNRLGGAPIPQVPFYAAKY